MLKTIAVIISLFVLFPFADDLAQQYDTTITVTVELSMIPSAEYAGFYAAKQLGFYEKAGMNVTFVYPNLEVMEQPDSISEEYDFSILWAAEGVERIMNGEDIFHAAQLFNRSSLVLASINPFINCYMDIFSERVAVWDIALFYLQSLFKDPEIFPFKKLTVPEDSKIMYYGAVEAFTARKYIDILEMELMNYNTDKVILVDFDTTATTNFPEDGIYCRRSLVIEDSTLCRRFVEATHKGWEYVILNPERSVEVCHKEISSVNRNFHIDPGFLQKSIAELSRYMFHDLVPNSFTPMDSAVFEKTAAACKKLFGMKREISYDYFIGEE